MNLMTVPSEVRLLIWRPLLTRPCPIDIFYERRRIRTGLHGFCHPSSGFAGDGCGFLESKQGRRHPELAPYHSNRWICVGPKFFVGVLRICRAIYVETIEVLYKENSFILSFESIIENPIFNFQNTRSLQICTGRLKGSDLLGYQKLIRSIRLHPETRLLITVVQAKLDVVQDLVEALSSLGPVSSCSLSLGVYPSAKALALQLLGEQKSSSRFTLYNNLPKELQSHILSFTDLVQHYVVSDGALSFPNQCCRKCCETLFGCCCVQFPRRDFSRQRFLLVNGSNFSSTCTCRYDPMDLLQVSPEFQQDALQVLFAQSTFELRGRLAQNLEFLMRIGRHLKSVKRIVFNMVIEFYENYDNFSSWEHIIHYVENHCSLPLLSISMVVSSIDLGGNEPPSEDEFDFIRVYYRAFIPGLQSLVAKGMSQFWIESSIQELNEWKTLYEWEVLHPSGLDTK